MKDIFLLDIGGNAFGGSQPSPIFSNEWDSNLWLSNLQFLFIEYLEARIAVTNVIQKIGSNLADISWYLPIKYNLFWNDKKNDVFVGTLGERKKSIRSYGIGLTLRLDVIGGSEDRVFIGVNEADLCIAEVVANSLQVMVDRGLYIPPVDILLPTGYASFTPERILHKDLVGLELDSNRVISVLFQVHDKGVWVDNFTTKETMNGVIAWLSESFDKLVKEQNV